MNSPLIHRRTARCFGLSPHWRTLPRPQHYQKHRWKAGSAHLHLRSPTNRLRSQNRLWSHPHRLNPGHWVQSCRCHPMGSQTHQPARQQNLASRQPKHLPGPRCLHISQSAALSTANTASQLEKRQQSSWIAASKPPTPLIDAATFAPASYCTTSEFSPKGQWLK